MAKDNLASVLKSARHKSGLTLRDAANLTGDRLTNPYISKLENGLCKNPSIRTLWHLSKIYKLSYHRLCKLAGYGEMIEVLRK